MGLPDGVALRRGVPEDADALTTLHHACWDEAYGDLVPTEMLTGWKGVRVEQVERRRGWLVEHPRETWLATYAGGLVGFANAGPVRGERHPLPLDATVDTELRALYVRAAWWGRGVGHALLTESVGDAGCCLWVLAGNDRAAGFYLAHGFAFDGATEDHDEGRHLRMQRTARQETNP